MPGDDSSMIRDEELSQILKDKMNTTIMDDKKKLNKTTMQVIMESQNEHTQSFIENSPEEKQEAAKVLTTEERR